MESSTSETNATLARSSKAPDSEELKRRPLRRSKTIRLPPPQVGLPWPCGQDESDPDCVIFCLAELDVDKERLISGLDCHRRFKVKEGYEMRDLPKFNDLTRYDVSEEQEMDLWKFEVDRLATAVMSPTPPSVEGAPEWYGPADSTGYNRLHVISTTLKYALDICVHDNELVLVEHQPLIVNKELLLGSHRHLLRNFDPEEGIIRFDKKIKLARHNDEVYHGLVNYLTAILARLLVRIMSGRFWVDNCLTTIAKFAAKLKVLGNDLPRAVSLTFEAYKVVQLQVNELGLSQPEGQQVPTPSAGKDQPAGPGVPGDWRAVDMGGASGARYFIVLDAFNRGISALVNNCVVELVWDEEVEQTADMFETSAVIYDTGFRGLRTQLCQERDGTISAAAERTVIHCAAVVFDVCRETWFSQPSAEGRIRPMEKFTTLDWNWTALTDSEDLMASQPGSRSWTNMRDVITALCPHSMFCGSFPTSLSQFARQVIQISDTTNRAKFYYQRACLAAARVRTSQYEASRGTNAAPCTPQYQSVYDTPMAHEGALAGVQGDPSSRLRGAMDNVEKWVIDERSIVITSLWYSWVVLAAVGILVCGGVGLVAVEDRIAGVDPSNLALMVWTAAGFLMIYAKSMRVENWPWRDFLRGRVVCRSVSEVQAVTGVDPQLLLAVLLRFETRVMLGKCGPFRGIFNRKAEDGFAIDVPPTTQTAAAGGHLFVGVLGGLGPALVELEARNREVYGNVAPKGFQQAGERYICRDFVDPAQYRIPLNDAGVEGKGRTSEDPLPLYPLCSNSLSWYQVQGVFVEKALFS
ncbi:hypothetical protein N658DRAFT_470579 [Parathielavia hyrcaniae]|uniref:Uncharacterized protein n=1 Tax=Parathielavia hyrcaniae TaxID=113614 RepID=A0AAN6Q1T8_9PEZI|nr:hypothetical protein N658DRAFT_470579 [Parathielavia hyrcaniae]